MTPSPTLEQERPREAAGQSVRRGARTLRHLARRSTAGWRMAPDFLVIGAQKSGTTSVYNYLSRHPQVRPAVTKEPHYFDEHYDLGWNWYRAQFPVRAADSGVTTGEASPSYLFHGPSAARVARDLPGVRLIAVLRDPVTRALSQYHHEVARGHEHLSFERALDQETPRVLAAEREAAPDVFTHALKHHAYLARGRYAEQLTRWYEHVAPEQLLVVVAEELYADPARTMAKVCTHLRLPVIRLAEYAPRNQRRYAPMPTGLEQRLRRYYAPHNERLADLLGHGLPWP